MHNSLSIERWVSVSQGTDRGFTANRTLQLDNFVKLKGFNWPGFRKKTLWRQDKGHKACVLAFVSAICNSKPTPISAEELFEVARVSIEATNQINSQG